jgi:serine/threonine protein kinase
VWQAWHELPGRDVAVKELSWPTLRGAAGIPPSRRQGSPGRGRLSHRNVIQAFDILEADGSPWIVMELLSPRSLRDLIRHEESLSPAQAAQVGLEILAAPRTRSASCTGTSSRPTSLAPDRVVLVDFGIAQAA